MAVESEELNFVVRMLFPDNKVTLDTSAAEAQIAKLRGLWGQLRQEMSAAPGGSGGFVSPSAPVAPSAPSGYPAPSTPSVPGGSSFMPQGGGGWSWDRANGRARFIHDPLYSSPAMPGGYSPSQANWARHYAMFDSGRGQYGYAAGPGFASGGSGINWGNNAPGPGNWSLSSGQWHQGPIRDPGSWAASSLGTARGYDQAMLRGRVEQSQQYYAQADAAAGSLNKVAAGLTQITTAGTSLAAGLILLNKSIGENADAWDNMQTRMVGWLNVATGGAQGVRAVSNLSSGIGGAAARGASLAAGALNTAGYVGAAGVLGRLGAPLGAAGTIAGGAVIGAGAVAVGYMGYQLFEADRELQESRVRSEELEQRRVAQRSMMLYNRIGAPEQLARTGIGLDADYNRTLNAAGAMSFRSYDRFLSGSINDLTGRNAGLRSKWMGGNASDEGLTAGRELADNLELQIRLVSERGRKREQEKQTQLEQLNIERQLTEVEQSRAGASLQGMRGVTERDWRRGLRFISQAERNGLNERTAMGIASIPGMGGRATEWLDRRNQGRIDALPQEWREESARSSTQLEEIKQRLKDAEAENQGLLGAIKDNAVTTAGLIRDLRTELDGVNRGLFELRATPRPGLR